MSDQPPFEPVTRQTVSQLVRTSLLERIRSGELGPGEPMPSERFLSDQFQVARTSVREAMQGLVSLGFVERRGNRAFVAERLPEVALVVDERKAFVRQLFETRRVLELPIFELATARAGDDQRREVAELAGSFDVGMPLADFRRLDRQFHTTIAAACNNPLLVEVYHKVLDALFRSEAFDSLLSSRVNEANVASIVEVSVLDHRAIASAFAKGDPVRVLAASEQHLGNVEQRMIDDLV